MVKDATLSSWSPNFINITDKNNIFVLTHSCRIHINCIRLVILSTALTLNYLVKHFFYFHFNANYHILILLLHRKNICWSPVMFWTHCQLMVTLYLKTHKKYLYINHIFWYCLITNFTYWIQEWHEYHKGCLFASKWLR